MTRRTWWWERCALAAVLLLALAVRLTQRHAGLIYPDGYDYLMMARGIGLHLTPTIGLGSGGALFVPPLDAALKPLFPALIALVTPLTGARAGAAAITVMASAVVVVLVGALTRQLTGSRSAGLLAAATSLLSPALAYWSGFTGPDPLAQALGLAAVMLAVRGRPRAAGCVGALCVASRPEFALVLIPLAICATARPTSREAAVRSLLAGAFTLAAVVGLLRPPLRFPLTGPLALLAALAGATVLQSGLAWLSHVRSGGGRAAMALSLAGASGVLVLSGRATGTATLLGDSWPLLALAACGLLLACGTELATTAFALLGAVLVLWATYSYKNPGSERYLAELLPPLCIAAGFAAALLSRGLPPVMRGAPAGALVGAAGVVLLAVIAPGRPTLAPDTFASLAPALAHAPRGALVSAAPDAYGFLLPGRPQRLLRPGARGLILLDAAQRAYAPGLGARGTVVAQLSAPAGFERPDGRLDTAPATLVRGVVIRLGTDSHAGQPR